MFELATFVIRGHGKVIDHYRWLRDSARSEVERQRFQSRLDEESDSLRLFLVEQSRGARYAA
jgi:hypothetical protein